MVEVIQPGKLLQTRTDFYERRAGPSVLAFEPVLCNFCGFAARTQAWQEAADTTAFVAHPTKPYFAELDSSKLTVDERFERCALVAESLLCTNAARGDLWLRASWAAYELGDPEGERYYQRKAVQQFVMAYVDVGQFEPEDGPRVVYLLGELNRRIGNYEIALEWFDMMEAAPDWLRQLARQQRTHPREWFS